MYLNEDKNKHMKMLTILNNLESKLLYDTDICKKINELINMTVETQLLIQKLQTIETHIPVIKEKTKDLTDSCLSCCIEARKNILLSIRKTILENSEKEKSEKYILKVQKTIDYCIKEYPTYIQSEYYKKYNSNQTNINDILNLQLINLLRL